MSKEQGQDRGKVISTAQLGKVAEGEGLCVQVRAGSD